MADRRNIAIVLVRHLTKSDRGNALYRGAGSIGIIGAARSGLVVGDDPACDDQHCHILAHFKGSRASAGSLAYRTVLNRDKTITVRWLRPSTCSADDIVVSAPKLDRTALQEAIAVVSEILSEGPLAAKEVAKLAADAQVAKRTLYRAKKALGVKSRNIGDGPRALWVWEPPGGLDALVDRLVHGPTSPRPIRDIVRPRRQR